MPSISSSYLHQVVDSDPDADVMRISTSPHIGLPRLNDPHVLTIRSFSGKSLVIRALTTSES
jgi:hypothetical protein